MERDVTDPPKGNVDGRNRQSDKHYGIWDEAARELISYRYFGTQSVRHDRHNSTGQMPVRPDMRTQGGIMLAPVAISMMDAAGIAVDALYHLALTQIDVHIFDPAPRMERMRTISTVVREARTQLFTEARFEDLGTGSPIGFGTANWAVINPTPEGFLYNDPGPGPTYEPPMPPLTEPFEARRRDGGGYVIETLSPRIGTDTLHHGPILVMMEAACIDAVSALLGPSAIMPVSYSTRIIRAGRKGPFVTSAEILSHCGDTITCRADIIDEGRNGETISIGFWQCRQCNQG